jgi:hypothetical protein
MARGRKTGGRDFPKGISANPAGRPRLPEDLRVARASNRIELDRTSSAYLKMSLHDLRAQASDEGAPTFDLLVARFILRAVEEADRNRFSLIIDRFAGPACTGGGIQRKTPTEIELQRRATRIIMADPELHKAMIKIARIYANVRHDDPMPLKTVPEKI